MQSQPLYQLLKHRPYPKYQTLDSASLEWLEERLKPECIAPASVIQGYQPYPDDYLKLRDEWFAHDSARDGIHGYPHMFRVSVFVWFVIQYCELRSVIGDSLIRSLLNAACVHDIRRHDDNADILHGKRSAEWVDQMMPGLLDPLSLKAIACHVDDMGTSSNELDVLLTKILKTADALDRFRLPKEKWWPDPARMPLAADELFGLCQFVTLGTERDALEHSNYSQKDMMLWMRCHQI